MGILNKQWVPPQKWMWVVYDLCNGDKETHEYLWRFSSKSKAQAFISHHLATYPEYGVDLSRPFKMGLCEE